MTARLGPATASSRPGKGWGDLVPEGPWRNDQMRAVDGRFSVPATREAPVLPLLRGRLGAGPVVRAPRQCPMGLSGACCGPGSCDSSLRSLPHTEVLTRPCRRLDLPSLNER